MNGRDFQHVAYIRKYCQAITESIGRFGSDYETFAGDWDYFQSVSMSIMQIGEHAKNLSEDFIASTAKQVPWHAIRGARNMVAHEYVKLDKAKIWETAFTDIPKLLSFCDKIIEESAMNTPSRETSPTLSVKERLQNKHHPKNESTE